MFKPRRCKWACACGVHGNLLRRLRGECAHTSRIQWCLKNTCQFFSIKRNGPRGSAREVRSGRLNLEDTIHGAYTLDARLPWDHLNVKKGRAYLEKEQNRAVVQLAAMAEAR